MKKILIFLYESTLSTLKMIYTKFRRDSEISYKDLEEINILYTYKTTNLWILTLHK